MGDLPKGFEKRRFVRLPLVFDPRYQEGQGPEMQIRCGDFVETGHLVDISIGGIGFVSPLELVKEAVAEVSVDLVLKDRGIGTIQARGIVRFCGASSAQGVYRVGLEFTEITEAHRETIATYIDNLL